MGGFAGDYGGILYNMMRLALKGRVWKTFVASICIDDSYGYVKFDVVVPERLSDPVLFLNELRGVAKEWVETTDYGKSEEEFARENFGRGITIRDVASSNRSKSLKRIFLERGIRIRSMKCESEYAKGSKYLGGADICLVQV